MPPERESNATGYTSLSSTLWRLREVLDQLLFKVFETRLVLASGQGKWLAKASRELDAALQELRHVEVLRAVEAIAIADQLALPPDLTLAQVARVAPPPWDTIFAEHRDALRELAADLDHATSEIPPPPADTSQHDEIDIVGRFLVETLANAPQASLTAFLA
ncbi:MAG TPA: hypothetical protein VHC23_03790 [Jatrophihabitans sp.]|jgi:hypothetical protein|nr:hypothetical protein [Jatrophihabitans sp.]